MTGYPIKAHKQYSCQVTDELLYRSLRSTAVSEHFSCNHLLLIPIDKLKTGRDSVRKAREAHFIHKRRTLEPLGINKRDDLYFATMFIVYNIS